MKYKALFDFESALAEYTGAPYVVLTDGCTHALELCFRYDRVLQTQFTAYTYLSVPMLVYHLGIKFTLTGQEWSGEYQFANTRIWDSARRLEPGMYRPGQLQCLSFGWSKPLQLGKVGAVLTDDYQAYLTLSRQRSDGRDLRISPWISETDLIPGWHYCPTLENCQQGLDLLPTVVPQLQQVTYPDCRLIKFDY
jgi:hypothetical protein